MAVDLARIRKYNIPDGVLDDNITEHISSATEERSERLGFSSYTGTKQICYEEILIHLTLRRIYHYEHLLFTQGFFENAVDLKQNVRFLSPAEVKEREAGEQREALELIAELLNSLADEDDTVDEADGIGMIAVGGNEEYKATQRQR